MTCSMAMCGFVNMSIVKTGAGLVSQREEAHFLQRCRAFAHGCAHCSNPKRNVSVVKTGVALVLQPRKGPPCNAVARLRMGRNA